MSWHLHFKIKNYKKCKYISDHFYSILRQKKNVQPTTEHHQTFDEIRITIGEQISNKISNPKLRFFAAC